ncbi:hypothetical protein GQ53DRAFT_803826 [Thozetella sp. PMI_491]|nr:hypothetical protein GQ53DRAFT_803826 [Thozetella sp. PMI_491]
MDPDVPRTGDDWRKISDPRERKKAQDRIAKRASRLRQRQAAEGGSTVTPRGEGSGSTRASPSRSDDHDAPREAGAGLATTTGTQDPALLEQMAVAPSSPNPDAFYLVLGAQTVIAALTANAQSIPVYCNVFVPKVLTSGSVQDPPAPLAPTRLQAEVPHLAFVAALPFAGLRDAILRALPHIDYQSLWRDSVSGGFIIWGRTPWMPQGWEVTEEWAHKWWFLLDKEVLETANFWRLQRGLPLLRPPAPQVT